MNRAVFVVVAIGIASMTLGQDQYTDKYDNINIEDILSNDRLLNAYTDCLLSPTDNKCTEDAKTLKNVLSEAFSNNCAKCTDKQKEGSKTVVKFLYRNKPELWNRIQEKFDPEGIFLKNNPQLTS